MFYTNQVLILSYTCFVNAQTKVNTITPKTFNAHYTKGKQLIVTVKTKSLYVKKTNFTEGRKIVHLFFIFIVVLTHVLHFNSFKKQASRLIVLSTNITLIFLWPKQTEVHRLKHSSYFLPSEIFFCLLFRDFKPFFPSIHIMYALLNPR